MKLPSVLFAFVLAAPLAAAAEPSPGCSNQPTAPMFQKAFEFLVGTWDAAKDGKPGEMDGWARFEFDLQGNVLTRRNHADIPAANGRPAGVHDDILIVYPGKGGQPITAMYFDNGGNVIQYSVVVSDSLDKWVFSSAAAPGAPSFRLTLTREGPDRFTSTFEMAMPGKDFVPLVAGAAIRRK